MDQIDQAAISIADLDRVCDGKGKRRYARRKGGEEMAERDSASAGRPRLGIEGHRELGRI
jgi:hypothetical protein